MDGHSTAIKQQLTDLISDPTLEQIEDLLGRFNLFEALGLVRRENKHSDFLAWLLDPGQTHGIGEDFLRLFVRHVATRAQQHGLDTAPAPFEADAWDLTGAEVRREWRRIDVFIRDETNRFVCVIENKVNIGEHSKQLTRYREAVEVELPGYTRRLFVLLSPDGVGPEDENEPYVPVAYRELDPLLGRLLRRRSERMSEKVAGLIEDYREMLDTHFNEDSEIRRMCRLIYQRHRDALNLIFEHRPDDLEEIKEELIQLVDADEDLLLENSSKTYIRFVPKEMDLFIPRGEPGWSHEGRMVLFEFENFSGRDPRIKLVLGPGPVEKRQAVYEMAKAHRNVFNSVRGRKLTSTWFKLGGYELAKGVRDEGPESRAEMLQKGVTRFKRGPMRGVVELFREARLPDRWNT